MKRIGMLTSGGDCQALNATMRGVAKGLYNIYGNEVERPLATPRIVALRAWQSPPLVSIPIRFIHITPFQKDMRKPFRLGRRWQGGSHPSAGWRPFQGRSRLTIRPSSPRRVFLTVTAGLLAAALTAGRSFGAGAGRAAGLGLGRSSAHSPEYAWSQKYSCALKGSPWTRR